jgi:predicted CxxxxCH...CXXCH cytochrome family protein
MSPLERKNSKAAASALLACALLFGCSTPNSQTFLDPETGKHVSGWLPAGHMTAATANLSVCSDCHGTSLDGGISTVSCTSCHLGGPTSVHPANWAPIYSTHGPYVNSAPSGTAACANQYCHGTDLAGVANSGPSCDKRYGIGGCHTLTVPFDPTSVICGACHRTPPSGTQFPNIAGKHGQHVTLGAYIICATCHNGSDGVSGITFHFNGTVEVFSLPTPTYNAVGVTATYNPANNTCSNVSCHGGQTTPNWLTGSIDVNTQCTSCHVVGTALATPQYNSAYSGQHIKHVIEQGIFCTACHDTGLLAVNHFTTLNTSAMEGPAKNTIKPSIQYNGATCNNPCHDPQSW